MGCNASTEAQPERVNKHAPSMRAYQYTSYGGPETMALSETVVPDAPSGGYRIKVHAFAINPIDYKRRGGATKALAKETFPVTLGYDASGVVDAVGEGAAKFSVGDEVYVRVGREFASLGTAAEYTVALEEYVAAKPAGMSHAEAAAVPLAAVTALQMLRKADFKAGDSVFVTAGAGGVGHYAIQIAKALGAGFVAATASAPKHDLLRSLGCDEVVDYKTEKYVEKYSDRRFDIALDMTNEYADLVKVVRPEGWVIGIVAGFNAESLTQGGMHPNWVVRMVVNLGSKKHFKAAAAGGVNFYGLLLRPNAEQLEELTQHIDAKALRSVVKVFEGMDAAPDAFKLLESGRATGKVVVTLNDM